MAPPESEYERCTLMNNAYAKLNQFMQSLMQSCLKNHCFLLLCRVQLCIFAQIQLFMQSWLSLVVLKWEMNLDIKNARKP